MAIGQLCLPETPLDDLSHTLPKNQKSKENLRDVRFARIVYVTTGVGQWVSVASRGTGLHSCQALVAMENKGVFTVLSSK